MEQGTTRNSYPTKVGLPRVQQEGELEEQKPEQDQLEPNACVGETFPPLCCLASALVKVADVQVALLMIQPGELGLPLVPREVTIALVPEEEDGHVGQERKQGGEAVRAEEEDEREEHGRLPIVRSFASEGAPQEQREHAAQFSRLGNKNRCSRGAGG